MERTLIWNGAIENVAVPDDLHEAEERVIWTYVQKWIAVRDTVTALQAAFTEEFPGLNTTKSLLPYGYAVCGRDLADGFFGYDRFSRGAAYHNHSQKPKPHASSQGKTGGESGTLAPHKHLSPRPTSSASLLGAPGSVVAASSYSGPMQIATPRTAGWMGSGATKQTVHPVAPRA